MAGVFSKPFVPLRLHHRVVVVTYHPNPKIKHLQMNYIDRTPDKYDIMIAKRIIHPQQLMFSCMECDDNCDSAVVMKP